MRKLTLALLAIACLTAGSTAMAELCTADPVPAATLLLPYFEVDLQDPNGITTLFSVTNASASAAVFHVVLWSDLSVPVLDFDVYLTGYDTQVINLRDIIVNGVFPRTADDGADPTDTISPQGPLSQDINFPGSTGPCFEAFPTGSIGSIYTTHMQAALTGTFSPLLGGCAGQNFGDNIARGYATMDSATQCSLLFPGDAGYFAGGIADSRNILFGDYQYVNPAQNFAQGETLVSIEATNGQTYQSFSGTPTSAFAPFAAGDYTFYGRYVGWTGVDQREPLPSVWGVRYNTGGAVSAGTDLIVWRDSTRAQGTFACASRPPWYPLASNNVVAFDEEENPYQAPGCTVSPCSVDEGTPFPAEAQRVAVGVDPIFTPASSGWIYLNLNTVVAGSANPNPPMAQSWVVAIGSSEGRFSYGANATPFNTLCFPRDPILIP